MRRVLLPLLSAAVLLSTTACATPGEAPQTAADTATELSASATPLDCPGADTPLADLELAHDVRTVTGPSTACIPPAPLDPVDDTAAPALPVTITDDEGREVTITDVSRILAVDISGTLAATVFALGLGDNVVGRDTSTEFDGTQHLPVVTKAGHTLNGEAIIATAPTVMLTDTSIGPKEVRQQLRDAGIAVVVISGDHRLDTIDALIGDVAAALGVPSRGDALIDRIDGELERALDEIAAVAPTGDERARMLFLYVRGNANIYYIFGRDTGADSLIDAVGGIDVATEIGWEGAQPMTAEALVAARPDVIVMMTAGLESMGGVDGLLEKLPAVAHTPAGENRRIIDVEDTAVLSFGPRSPEVVLALARALYAPTTSVGPTAP